MTVKPIIVPLPPYSRFLEPPEDQPGCEMSKCPQCNCMVWISAKKRSIKLESPRAIFLCYDCLSEQIQERKGVFQNADSFTRIDI